MDYWQCTTTVHRSTNWAIEGDIVSGELWKVMLLIGVHNCPWELVYTHLSTWHCFTVSHITGGVAQMVERSLSMREVPGSIPGASNYFEKIMWSLKQHFNDLKQVLHCYLRKSAKTTICMQRPGIEPGPPAWQASILPLNQRCHTFKALSYHNWTKFCQMS